MFAIVFMCCCHPMSVPAADETDGGSEVVRGAVHRKCDGHVSARARAPSCLALVDPLDAPHGRVFDIYLAQQNLTFRPWSWT